MLPYIDIFEVTGIIQLLDLAQCMWTVCRSSEPDLADVGGGEVCALHLALLPMTRSGGWVAILMRWWCGGGAVVRPMWGRGDAGKGPD